MGTGGGQVTGSLNTSSVGGGVHRGCEGVIKHKRRRVNRIAFSGQRFSKSDFWGASQRRRRKNEKVLGGAGVTPEYRTIGEEQYRGARGSPAGVDGVWNDRSLLERPQGYTKIRARCI